MYSFKQELLNAQIEIGEKYEVVLTAKVRECDILRLGQEEPLIELDFIQYAKFQKNIELLKKNTTVTYKKSNVLYLHNQGLVIL